MEIVMFVFNGVINILKIFKKTNRSEVSPEVSIILDFQKNQKENYYGDYYATSSPYSLVRDIRTEDVYTAYLRVKNTGTGVARNVTFNGDFSFVPMNYGKALENIDFLVNGIDTMLPGHTVSEKLFSVSGPLGDVFRKIFYQYSDSILKVDVTYENPSGRTYKNKAIRLDFAKSVDPDSYT